MIMEKFNSQNDMKKHYVVTIKEIGHEKPVVTEFFGDIDRRKVVEFYGLEEPDVEWYRIEELKYSDKPQEKQ